MRRQTDFESVPDSCFLSRWLQLHCFSHFFRSLKRPLQTSDLFNVDQSLYPQTNLQKYKRKRVGTKQLTISSLVSRVLFLWAGILAIIGAGLTFSGPIVIKKIMSLLKSSKVGSGEHYTAYSYVAVWVGLYLLRIFINEYADRMFFLEAVKAEQILTTEILKKISRLSPNIRRSNVLNYFVNDIKLVFNFIKSCAGIFGSISTLVFVQIFLVLEVGWFGLVLIVVFLLVGTAQGFLYRKMSRTRNKKMSLVSQRIGRNIQLFSSIKQLKLLGWEELIIQKDQVYREGVDRYNSTYFTFSNIFDLVINLTPTFVFLAVLILKFSFEAHFKFDIAKVYVVLAFAGMTYGPSKSLLNNVINTADAYSSITKVNQLLDAEQIKVNRTKDPTMKPGTIRIDNLVSSYDTHFINNSEHLDSDRDLREENQKLSQNKKLLEKDEERDIIEGLVVRVPFDIELHKGDRLILLGEPNAGKSELMNTILGNLNIISGEAKYNGKIGYLPQKLWFQNSTARSNIAFGEPVESHKLGKIYRMLGIQDEMSLLNKADLTLMNETSNISDGQKRRIALGRVLYSDPDIMLLDEVFASMDQETIALIYGSLRKHYHDRTIIISTHLTSFIRPSDKVLLMKDGQAVEFATYKELFDNKQSYIHRLLDKDDNAKVDHVLLRRQLKLEKKQRDLSERKKQVRRHKLGHFVKGLLALTKGLSKQEIEERLKIPVLKYKKSEPPVPPPAKRGQTVSIKYYWRFFRSAPLYLYALLFLICLSAQAIKVFSDWWIGSISKLPWKVDEHSALLIYILLTVAFGLLLALAGCLSPCVSLKNSNFIGQRLRNALAFAKLSWFETQGTTKASTRLGRDSEQIFLLNNTLQNMFKTSLMFFATIIMVGLGSPLFLLLATAIIILNITILYYFMRTEREQKALGAPYNPQILKTYNDIIQGIDQLRAFNKVQWSTSNFMKDLYNYTVCKVNYKFIYNGMSIACELSSLVIIAAAAIIAVNSRFTKEVEDIAVIGTSISFSLRLTGIVTSFIKDAIGLELAMKGSSKKNFDIIDKNPVNIHTLPPKPADWPLDNSVQFDKVSLSYEGYDEPTVKQVDFTINSGENVVICGKDGSGKSSLLSAMCKLVTPVKNLNGTTGCIRIAGYDIAKIGNKFITQNNMLLGTVPFLYTATLRENMDPFNTYSDQQIQECLEIVDLWGEIKPNLIEQNNATKLSIILTDAGKNLNLGLQQKLNIARALLYKPNILLLESATSCLDEHTEEQIQRLIRQSLKKSTICVITQQIDTTMQSDKVIYMSRGKVKQIGVPMELLRNPESSLSKLVRNTSPELYLKKVASRMSSTGSIGQ